MADYAEINRANWDDRVPAHLASAGYKVHRFLVEPDFISDVVRFDLPRLGDVAGLRGVHLQCHIGTDTISLARLGASMTGLDFSGQAVEAAQKLASDTRADATFVQRARNSSDRQASVTIRCHDRNPLWFAYGGHMPVE